METQKVPPAVKERRRAARLPVALNTICQGEDIPEILERTFSKDICDEGMCVLLRDRLPVGTPVTLAITLSEPTVRVIRASGHVTWQSPWKEAPASAPLKFLTGIRFSNMNGANLSHLQSFITQTNHSNPTGVLNTLKQTILSRAASFPVQMTLLKNPPVRITAVANYLPDQVVNNEEIIKSGLDTTDTTIRRALGAVERRAASPQQSNAEMMTRVAKRILQETELDVSTLDRIICSADPPDWAAPNVASVVQKNIGAFCPAIDVEMSCAGWLSGVDLASRCIATGEKRILVLASSLVGSRITFRNRMHRAIFGDGAGGVLLEHSDRGDILSAGLWTDGRYYDKIFVPYSWSQMPDSIPKEFSDSFFMSPNQEDFFTTMEFNLRPFCERLWEAAGVSKGEIDHFLLHQPSMPLFEYSLRTLQAPREKVMNLFPRYGNLVAAEMPVYIAEGIQSGRIHRGDLVFALAYGAGFTMGGMVMRY